VTGRDLESLVDPGHLAAYLGGSLLTLALGYGLSRRAGLDGAASTFQPARTAGSGAIRFS
jgi:hypothetical protein